MARAKPPALPNAPALYLLHLEAKVGGHAGHYIGQTDDLAQRIAAHRRGSARASRLLAYATAHGIGWRLVR
jgi:predicted GIY-YIG superfamily endonuclease